MIKIIKSIAAFIAIAFTISSCSKAKTGTESLVPGDAKTVVTINARQLMDKFAANGINVDDAMQMEKSMMDTTYKAVSHFWKDEKSTGIDFSQPIVIAMNPEIVDTNKSGVMRIIFGVNNKENLMATVKKQIPTMKLTEEGSISYIMDGDKVMGMNKQYAVMIQEMDATSMTGIASMGNGTFNKPRKLTTNEKKELIKGTFRQNANKSILGNKDYSNMPIGKNDMKVWNDQAFALDQVKEGGQGVQIFTRMFRDVFKESSTTSIMNFDNGAMNSTSQTYFNKEVAKVIKNTKSQNLDLGLLTNFPGSKLNALMGLSINPTMILDLAKYMKQDGVMNVALGELKMSQEDVFGAITGDALVAISDLDPNEKNPENINMGIIFKIKDKSKLDKILSIPDIAKQMVLENNIYTFSSTNDFAKNAYLGVNRDVAIFSPNRKLVENYLAGTSKNTFATTGSDLLKAKTAGFYMDINSFTEYGKKMSIMNSPFMGSIASVVLGVVGKMQKMQMTAGSFKDNYIETNSKVVMDKSNANSLVYLIKSGIQEFAKMKMKPRNAHDIDLSDVPGFEDDMVIPPPPPPPPPANRK